MELSAVERLNMKERKTMAFEWMTAEQAASALGLKKSGIHYRGRTGTLKTKREGRSIFFKVRVAAPAPGKAESGDKLQPEGLAAGDKLQDRGSGDGSKLQAETLALLKALGKGKGRSRESERALRVWKKAGMPDVGECPTCGRALTQ